MIGVPTVTIFGILRGSPIKNIIVIIVLMICSGCNRDGPLLVDVPIDEVSRKLDEATPRLMKDDGVVGLSIAVIRSGKVAIFKSFGYSDLESKRKIEESTVYRVASLGKPVFAYIVVELSKQGKIDLDVPLYSYYKEEVVKNDSRSKLITARMVLSHSTGLPNLNGKQSDINFNFTPGTEFKYSGHAYLYLQKVIENITKKNLNELAEEIVFKPLKMEESSFIWRDEYRPLISSSYDSSGEKYPAKEKPEIGYSAWSLFTTIKDYSLFISRMLNTSNEPDSIAALLLKPSVEVADDVKWGLGWGLQDTVPNQSFWHWGSMAGFRHYVVGYPKEGLAVLVFTNSSKSFKMVDDVMAKAIGGSYPSYDWF